MIRCLLSHKMRWDEFQRLRILESVIWIKVVNIDNSTEWVHVEHFHFILYLADYNLMKESNVICAFFLFCRLSDMFNVPVIDIWK